MGICGYNDLDPHAVGTKSKWEGYAMLGRKLNLVTVLVVLMLTCLACGPGGGQEPAVPPTQASTAAPKPTAVPEETATPKATIAPKESAAPTGQAILELDKTTFAQGEEIQVRFTTPVAYPSGAWVGIIPSRIPHGDGDVNDEHDVDYQYLEGQTSGVLTFTAPNIPGFYDLRLNDDDPGGNEVASVTFTVAEPAGAVQPNLWLDKFTFAPGEKIQVHFTAPDWYPAGAWVGIIPSSVPHGDETVNDENDIDYLYLEQQTSGVLTFIAPATLGSYDLRLHDTDQDGQEVVSVTFTVAESGGAGTPALSLDKVAFAPNEEFQVFFATPADYPADAWVGIIPSSVPHGDEAVNDDNNLDYRYLESQTSGMLTFTAPGQPGSYDLRMHDADSDGQEVASVTFTVTEPAGSVQPTLWLDKTTFAPGEEIQVHFTAPDWYPDSAWVGIIPSSVPHGTAAVNDENDIDYQYLEGMTSGILTFIAPDTPGSYDFRLNENDSNGKEVASVTFQVE
jgi:hypothetical protein